MPEKFVVPQFIDSEDKILGPITVRQFLVCLVATGAVFLEYTIFRLPWSLLGIIPTVTLAGVFGFLKVNGQPFHIFFINVLQTKTRPPLRVWNKEPTTAEIRAFLKKEPVVVIPPTVSKGRPESTRLRDLTLTVNTGGVYNADEDQKL